jgi:DNA-binding transcriptional ArsR family regulator
MSTSSIARSFEALSDPHRCRVVELLGGRPHSAGELARLTGLSPSAMSRHLRLLLHHGLITDRRNPDDARVRVFSLDPDGLIGCQAWLDQIQAHWRTNLASFKRHAESEARDDRPRSTKGP